MAQIITCYTLFDCTKTGIRQRNKLPDSIPLESFLYKRNTQANLDTILQIISLRSQPEIITEPVRKELILKEYEFGFIYEAETDKCNVWSFDFEVQHLSVFNDGIDNFGNLYKDCDKIPMILCKNEHPLLTSLLDISPELRNIYFKFYE